MYTIQQVLVYLPSCIVNTPQSNFKAVSSPQKETLCPHDVTSHPHPTHTSLPQATSKLLSLYTDWPAVTISHKWNHVTCGHLCLASFIQQNASGSLPESVLPLLSQGFLSKMSYPLQIEIVFNYDASSCFLSC